MVVSIEGSPRRCGTCRHYEPSSSWGRGWCRNSLLYDPGQSQLVQQDDLNCSRGQGDFWESAIDSENLSSETAGHANVKFPRLSPLRLFAPSTPQLASAGGGMMFSRSSGGGSGGGNDDDYGFQDEEPTPPRHSRSSGGGSGNGGRQRTVQFEPEERYWTEYLRIALPVIGLLLMLGLFWYWAQNLINDGNNGPEPAATEQMIGAPGIITPTAIPSTPEPTVAVAVPTQPPAAQPTATSNPAANAGNNQSGAVATPPAASGTGQISIDSKVVTNDVVNLRPDASTSGTAVTVLTKGEQLTVIAGPQTGEGYTWWQVKDANGNEGWVVSDGINLAP